MLTNFALNLDLLKIRNLFCYNKTTTTFERIKKEFCLLEF